MAKVLCLHKQQHDVELLLNVHTSNKWWARTGNWSVSSGIVLAAAGYNFHLLLKWLRVLLPRSLAARKTLAVLQWV